MTSFTVFGKPQPQGSTRGFLSKRGKIVVTSDNKKLRPFRQELSQTALVELRGKLASKGCPVSMKIDFYLAKPPSAKKRTDPCVKPDLDKLVRAVLDSLTGIAYEDDGQVVSVWATKRYGSPERVEVHILARKEEA